MSAVLAITDLRLQYVGEVGVASVLDGVNLTIDPGEVVGLVGESGCGKSTLARAILGALPRQAVIEEGEIRISGQDIVSNERPRTTRPGKGATFVPQDTLGSFSPLFQIGTQMIDTMRGSRDAFERVGWWERTAKCRAAAIDKLRAVHLADAEDIFTRYPHQLSGGQRQRVLIAMALLPNPRLLVADEPTASLDLTVQANILRLLRSAVESDGLAMLFTTHDLAVAWEICDRVAVMYAGQVLEVAPRDLFFKQPRHPYTTQLLASVPRLGRPVSSVFGGTFDAWSPPGGCRFHPRCEIATEQCRVARPPLRKDGGGRLLACYHR